MCATVLVGSAAAHPGGGGGSHGGGGFHGGGGAHGGGYRGGWRGRGGAYGHGWYGGRGWYGGGWGWGFGLPWYYDTYWWNGVPYYYADDVYYEWNPDAAQYQTVQPPAGLAEQVKAQGPVRELFIYPKAGQSNEQLARDRNECKQWAATQSGYNPNPDAAQNVQADSSAKPSDYLRAERACLEGRNYSVD